MIKCSKTTIKYSNTHRKDDLSLFLSEYKRVVSAFVDLLWEQEKIFKLIPKETTNKINSWLSKRAIQCAGKQASGMSNYNIWKNVYT